MRLRAPEVPERLARQVAAAVEGLRAEGLYKPPGVAETIDWAEALATLGRADARRGVGQRHARHGAEVPRGPRAGARQGRGRARAGGRAARHVMAGARDGRRHDGPHPPRPRRGGAARRHRSPTPPALAEVGMRPALVGLLGRPGHAGAPARGRARLRPGLRGRVRGPARRPTGRAAEPDAESVTLLRRHRRRAPPRRSRRRASWSTVPCFALRWSDREVLRAKDFARCTRRRARRGPPADGRPAPRRAPAGARAASARPAAGAARSTSAPPPAGRCAPAASRCAPSTAEAGDRPRRVVLLCDVSGSMEAYARALVRFAHVAVVGRAQVEVFTLGTRCTRDHPRAPVARSRRRARRGRRRGGRLVGRHPARRGPAARSTSAGACAGLARGAVVVILSDGWDRGDPDVLGRAGAPPAARRPPGRVGEPAQGEPRLRAARPRAWPRPCRTSTSSSRATRSRRSRSWPR